MVSCIYCTLTLTLIYPPSVWTHWATYRRHPCLSRAAASASKLAKSSFSQYVVHGLLSSSSSDLYVCYPVFPRDAQTLLCHLWMATSSVFANVTVNGHTSALYRRLRRVDSIIASYNLVFTFRLILLFLQIFFIYRIVLLLLQFARWRLFHSWHWTICSCQGSRIYLLFLSHPADAIDKIEILVGSRVKCCHCSSN